MTEALNRAMRWLVAHRFVAPGQHGYIVDVEPFGHRWLAVYIREDGLRIKGFV